MSLLEKVLQLDDAYMLNNIWDIKQNLVLKRDGSVFAIYRIPAKIVNMVDSAAKEEHKQLITSALSQLRQYHNFHLKRQSIDQDLVHKFKTLSKDIDWESSGSALADYIFNGQIEALEQSIGTLYDYQWYLIVPLKSIHVSVDLKEVVKQSYRTTRNKVLAFVGLGEAMPQDWYRRYETQREVLESRLSLLEAKRLTTEENIFINRIKYLAGHHYDRDFEVSLVQNSIENLDDVAITFEHVNVMKLSNGEQSSYVAQIPINSLPENMSYLHLEEELQTLRFPVDSDFMVEFSVKKGALSLFGRSQRAKERLKNAMVEAQEAGDSQKTTVMRSRYLLDDLHMKFDEDEPLVSYLHTLTISAQSMEELKKKFDLLYACASQLGIELVRANADQLYLFYKNRIGEVLTASDKNFIQSMSLEAFCENLFFTTRKVGNEIGFCIGRIDNGVSSWQGDYRSAIESSSIPVYVNLLQANKQNVEGKTTNNPHTAVIGETGTGKSFLIKLMFTYLSLMKTKMLYIDPKAEMRAQYLSVLKEYEEKGIYPEIQSYIRSINFVTLDAKNEDNYGTLDPIVFLSGQEATDLADSMIASLLGKDNSTVIKTGYLSAIETVLARRAEGEQVGMLQVFDEMKLSDRQEVADAGDLLSRLVKHSILSLCFSDGRNSSISLTNKITILEITGLDLPKESDQREMTESQKKSLAVMYALGYFCRRFGALDKTEETVSVFDEAWLFNSTSVGRSVLKEMKRIGRSFNNFMIFGTQSVKDLVTEDDTTGFGTVFAFLEKTEVDEVLDYLDIPKSKTTREWIGNMTMGQCIYYDPFGRRERITVDGMFPELTVLFDTVETKLEAV